LFIFDVRRLGPSRQVMSNRVVSVRQVEFADFEMLRDGLDAKLDIVQLEQGRTGGKLTRLSVGSLGISVGSFSRGYRASGIVSSRRWTLGTVLEAPALMQHFEMGPGQILSHAPGHEHYSRYFGANTYAVALVEPDELFAFLATQPGAQDAAAWHQTSTLLTTDQAKGAANVRALSTLLAMLRRHGPRLSADSAEFFKRNILELLTASVRDAARYRGPRLRSAVELVRDVDRYMIDAGSRPIHVSELCEKFRVGRRALHRAFIDVLGVPPITFLRRKRLGDVHAALLVAGPLAMVKEIAIEHGFLELGRFAGDYRRMFGELPSETLQRQR
jgi:AraC family ethanolamine operon transcriptional activator